MAHWLKVTKENTIAIGEWYIVNYEHHRLLVINSNDQLYAIEDLCTHDGGTLNEGEMEGEEIICPRHGARFCIRTGEATVPPAYEPIETFPVRIHEGMIEVNIETLVN